MPGFLSPRSTDTYYIQEFHWTRSPSVWKTLIKIFLSGVVCGAVLIIWMYSSGHAKPEGAQHQKPVPCRTSQNK